MSKQKNRGNLIVKNRVADCRKSLSLSQEELADLIGSSVVTISSIETGKYECSCYLALCLSAALRVPVEYLFYLDSLTDCN